MGTDREFITKFNELDDICKKIYPNQTKGFDAIRTFGKYSLNKTDKKTLYNILDARNMYSHDKNNLIHFDTQAVKFVQGLIDGANRKYYNNRKGQIDSNLENLRTKNLRIMSSMMKNFDYQYRILSDATRNKYRQSLMSYIAREKNANGLEDIKDNFFSFKTAYNNIRLSNEMNQAKSNLRNQRRQRYEQNFAKEKQKQINACEASFEHIISSLGVFAILKKKKAKESMNHCIALIKKTTNFDELEDIVDEIEDIIDDNFADEYDD